ncbi:efflux RND transporter periplasmic adaptor subunit [Schlesneria paludicola]|uniref:efflux RND transporter periplasmic adaptor subunit n=1 Tax=Schlesneria paludicola TaxID=360056 RepID=UPI00029A1285|nr:efflux RND transporter periplasmic adaptor subunit [Schlesneria paludicola]
MSVVRFPRVKLHNSTLRPQTSTWNQSSRSWATLLTIFVTGCGHANVYHEPPPPEVVITKPVQRSVTSYLTQTGTAQASERVELRARVKGFLSQRAFKDGEAVKVGQLLFVIDEEPFRTRLAQLNAKVAEAESALTKAEQSKLREINRAKLDLDQADLELAKLSDARVRSLYEKNTISKEELDRSDATLKKAEAQVASDRANLDQVKADYQTNILSAKSTLEAAKADAKMAEIDLGYCRITAPIDGRINAREFDVGNYVGDGQSTVLASIVKVDPIYTFISPGEDDLLRVQQANANSTAATLPMEMGLSNETGYPHQGHVDYIDPSVDTGTGTIRLRGVFSNPGGAILPGLFVRVRIPAERRETAIMVPDRSLGSDQGGSYLLVVGADDKVERRTVEAGEEIEGLREVRGSISLDDRVVVDGLLRARPGLKVSPKQEETPPTTAKRTSPSRSSTMN